MRSFLTWLLHRHADLGGLSEIRIHRTSGNSKGVWTGYCEPGHTDTVAARLLPTTTGPRSHLPYGAVPKSGEASIYVVLNPIQPTAQVCQGDHSIKRRTTAAKDSDVICLSVFLIDIDPVRPVNTSSTDIEKSHALVVCKNIEAFLGCYGICGMRADSGNGYHILVPMLPTSLAMSQSGRLLLKGLAARFDTAEAKVDLATWNPSRLTKIYGSLAVKGESTEDRPHRHSSIDVSAPPEDQDLFSALASFIDQVRQEAISVPKELKTPQNSPKNTYDWSEWRKTVLSAVNLHQVYGDMLTGRQRDPGWLEARDPDSPSGDKHPSAGVADGAGEAARGTFHSFRSGESLSLWDWLLRHRFSDIKQVNTYLSQISGIPLPTGQRATSPSGMILPHAPSFSERFAVQWTSASDNEAKSVVIENAIEELLALPPWVRKNLQLELQQMSGITSQGYSELVKKLRKRKKAEEPDLTTEGDLAIIVWIKNVHKISHFFQLITHQLVLNKHFFQYGEELIFVRETLGPLRLHAENFPGLLTGICEIAVKRVNYNQEEVFVGYDVLAGRLASAFLESPLVREQLPDLRSYTRAPSFGAGWTYVGTPGWHAHVGLYYDGPPIPPRPGRSCLLQMLQDFAWATEADFLNYIGMLLTALTLPLWLDGHPILVINGNRPGTGKTTLAQLLAILSEAEQVESITWVIEDEELEKRIGSRVEAGARVILVDNVKARGPVESAVLERTVTAAKPSFRRLGTNTEIVRPVNDLLFILTMNSTRLGQDLRRRSVPVNLSLTEDPTHRTFNLERIGPWVQEHRIELVGELAGIITGWVNAGRPLPEQPARHSVSNTWAAAIDGMLWHCGLGRFLQGYDQQVNQLDSGYEWMLEFAQKCWELPPAHTDVWVSRVETAGLGDRLKDKLGRDRNPRAKNTILGTILNEYAGKVFPLDDEGAVKLVQAYPRGMMHKPVYSFAKQS